MLEPTVALWKMMEWVRQLGWWHSQLNGKIKMFQTTNQMIMPQQKRLCPTWKMLINSQLSNKPTPWIPQNSDIYLLQLDQPSLRWSFAIRFSIGLTNFYRIVLPLCKHRYGKAIWKATEKVHSFSGFSFPHNYGPKHQKAISQWNQVP